MIEVDTIQQQGAKIRVIGVGGGGGNAINSMISRGLVGVDFVAANTDAQDLHKSKRLATYLKQTPATLINNNLQ